MRYRKVDPRIWNDAKFRQLSDDGKLAFFMLLTHPHMTAVGAMRGTLSGMASEMAWEMGRIEAALQPALDTGMVRIDRNAAIIWLPNFLKYNEPEGPNAVKKAWPSALAYIPECSLKDELCHRLVAMFDAFSDGMKDAIGYALRHAIRDAMSVSSRIQEQEQEQEQVGGNGDAVLLLRGDARGDAKNGHIGFTGDKTEPKFAFTGITQGDQQAWQSAYPGISVPLELERAALWVKGDWPARRKVKWGAFLIGWFNRAQQGSKGRPS